MNLDIDFSQNFPCYLCGHNFAIFQHYYSGCPNCNNFGITLGFTTVFLIDIDGYTISLQYVESFNTPNKFIFCNYRPINDAKNIVSFTLPDDNFDFRTIPPSELLKTLQMYNLYQ